MNKQSLKMHAKKMTLACSILAASLSVGTSAFAFSDLKGNAAESKINALNSQGILNGISKDLFAPKSKVTFAQGIQIIVSGLGLSSASSAKASDYFDKVKDNAWYASAFVAAKQTGLTLDKTVDPNAAMTRIQFATLMLQALQSKGQFPVTMMYVNINDGAKLSNTENGAMQTLLNTRIVSLDKDGNFRPFDTVTRAEAAVWIYDAMKFAKEVIQPVTQTPAPSYESSVTLSKAADGVNKATLTVGGLPNSGYGVIIERIEFGADKTAVIYYRVTKPDPDGMYLQVISSATAQTYLPEGYKATAQQLKDVIALPGSK
ncbi:S-layer homology domain-containing protein [Paenibacillus sp. NFR01]|uniref:S-layer homology domain-containing protein n=1 Tax=Paenibacillus sp. NFR01 TaxID=1566279 RepID=UPI0008B5CD3D|nr:S-layer homology domain-containing protein [Paenibacillus sp. NFR01]SET96458.1 S-layer homology domain-containing protein [Paenibacillus sp. NFR01]